MTREKLLLACCSLLFLLFHVSNCTPCVPSSCGNIHNITSPFRLTTDPPGCGSPDFELSCEDNSTVFYVDGASFIVKAINYNNYSIRVVDPGVDEETCSSLPRYPLSLSNFSDRVRVKPFKVTPRGGVVSVTVMKCVKPANSTTYSDVNSCIQQSRDGFYRYAFVGELFGPDLREGCSIEAMTLLQSPDHSVSSFTEIHRRMAFGFDLILISYYCNQICGPLNYCYVNSSFNVECDYRAAPLTFKEEIVEFARRVWYALGDFWNYIRLFLADTGRGHFNSRDVLDEIRDHISYRGQTFYWITHAFAVVFLNVAGKSLCGSPFVMTFIIYKWRKRHLSNYHTVEEFLKGENNPIMSIRYAYSDIKKMTGDFKDMLGKGGFGSVYKGKLRSGQFSAVKMLETSKANGQDFINEVATVGRIHHANIVRLIGFCSQRSKHALVYEFMSNGSLDTHIFGREKSTFLSWEKLYEISQGVARGIEYLHRGCDTQILHFDIKPHNILLDENFAPKISDFGLAKFYPKMESMASLTAARGTIGYMAPELFYKNIGRLSYKADVYSFGMLLLEMAGKRKNIKVPTGVPSNANLSQIYYPFLVYDKLVDGNLEIEDATYEENKMVRKMIIIGLWCIQMQPSDRPSMNEVVEMLEGNLEDLQFPPKPLLFPIKSMENDEEESSSTSVE